MPSNQFYANQHLSNEDYDFIYSRVPRLNVEIIIPQDNGVVLAKRDIEPWKDFWHLPGGRVLKGETPEDAAIRIAKYETGLSVGGLECIGAITYPTISTQDSNEWPIGIVYLVESSQGKLQGSEFGQNVRVFTTLPEPMIAEQAQLLVEKWSQIMSLS